MGSWLRTQEASVLEGQGRGWGGHSRFAAQAWLGSRRTDSEISESGPLKAHQNYPTHLQKGKQARGEEVMDPRSHGRLVVEPGWNPGLHSPSASWMVENWVRCKA